MPGGRDPVAEERFSREHGQDLGHDAEARQGHDVDLGVAEEPEEVLPQERAPAVLVDVERGLRGAVEDAEQAGGDERRGGQREQRGGGQDRPDEDGETPPAHARGPVVDDGGGEVEPGADHADPDDGEADEVRVHPPRGLGLQRRVPRPARREAPQGQRRQDDEVAGREDPQRKGLDAGERHAARPDHEGHEPVAEGAHDDGRGHHHHDRPVLADHRDVGAGPDDVVGRVQQLGADGHRQQAAGEEEQEAPRWRTAARRPCGPATARSSGSSSSTAPGEEARARRSWRAGS